MLNKMASHGTDSRIHFPTTHTKDSLRLHLQTSSTARRESSELENGSCSSCDMTAEM